MTAIATGASFELATAARIVFGAGKVAEVPSGVRGEGGTRVLVFTGRSGDRAARLEARLHGAGISAARFSVSGEPTLEAAREATARLTAERCDVVVANGGDPLDYLEVIGRGRPLTKPALPFIAVPTTAGTGSEVTKSAVLASKEAGAKASLRSASMLARVAVVDPDLLEGAPSSVLASSGLDALSQLVEPFLSIRADPLTDALAREGIRRSMRSLRRAVLDGAGADAREDLALASLFGGLCLANAGLGAVHGFAAPAGGMFDAPHGAVCAALLPATLDVNLRAITARAPKSPVLERLREVAVLVTGDPAARAEDAASSMKANPIVLTDDELHEIAERSLG